MNSASDQADRGPRQRLFQPCNLLAARDSPVQHGQQGFHLAEFRRPFVPRPVDGTLEQPEPDLLGQASKRLRIESETRGVIAIAQGKIALGAVGQHLDGGIGPRQP